MADQDQIYQSLEHAYLEGKEHWGKNKMSNVNRDILSLLMLIPHKTILEVGCGKGALTKELVKIADKVTAIDVSQTAIEATKQTAPKAECITSSLEEFTSSTVYDVIICSEVLYYLKDRQKAIRKLRELGRYLITSHFIFSPGQAGLGSIMYELLLMRFKTIKVIPYFKLRRAEFTLRTLRRLSNSPEPEKEYDRDLHSLFE